MRTRAERRALTHRKHTQRRKWLRKWAGWNDEEIKANGGVIMETPKGCSCYMCGNPRKYFNGATIQERRNNG